MNLGEVDLELPKKMDQLTQEILKLRDLSEKFVNFQKCDEKNDLKEKTDEALNLLKQLDYVGKRKDALRGQYFY